MRTFLILMAAIQAGAALHPSDYRPLHLAAVVLSLAVLGLVSWLNWIDGNDRITRRELEQMGVPQEFFCEFCSDDGRCSICK